MREYIQPFHGNRSRFDDTRVRKAEFFERKVDEVDERFGLPFRQQLDVENSCSSWRFLSGENFRDQLKQTSTTLATKFFSFVRLAVQSLCFVLNAL